MEYQLYINGKWKNTESGSVVSDLNPADGSVYAQVHFAGPAAVSYTHLTGAHSRGLGGQKRHRLTLHVGTHQRAVGVVVLQEGNHGRSHGEHHLGRYVHQVDGLFLELGCLCAETSGYVVVNKMAVLVQGFVRLGYHEVVFLVGGQVNPVSYTHLDVYKRQHHHNPGFVFSIHGSLPFQFL